MKQHPLARRASLGALFAVASAVPAVADVLVVAEPGGGGDYTGIQAAVNNAAEGDTILVKDGSYQPFEIVGKSVSVVAEQDEAYVLAPLGFTFGRRTIHVADLLEGQRVLVQGLRTNFGVRIVDCAGSVWFDEVICAGASAICSSGAIAGAGVTGSANVTFTRCTLNGEVGGEGPLATPISADGANVVDSNVTFIDCTLNGGWGRSAGEWFPEPWGGGAGLRISGSSVTTVGCAITGGEGGLAGGEVCEVVHAPGGAGVVLAGVDPVLRRVDTTIAGGVADLEPLCPGQTGPPGPTFSGTGTVEDLPGISRGLSVNSPRRGGETVTFEATGLPGEIPLLVVSDRQSTLNVAGQGVPLLIELPFTDVFVLNPVPSDGPSTLSFAVPNVGAFVGAVSFYGQVVFFDATPAYRIGAGTTLVLLDAGL